MSELATLPTAPAAAPPSAPAPAPADATAAPEGGGSLGAGQPPRQSLSEAIEAAKASQSAANRPHHSATQPRDEGRFAGPPNPLTGEPTETPVDPNAPPPEVDPNAPPAAPADEEYVPFVLPGHAERGEADIVLEFPNTPEVQERLKRLTNDAMRKKDYDAAMQSVQQQTQQVEQFETRVQIDPAGFVAEYVTRDQLKPLILAQLASDETLLDELRDDLSVLDDPAQRRRVAAEARLALQAASQTAAQTMQQRAQNRATTAAVATALQALVPPHLTDAQQDQWLGDTLNELAHRVASGQLDRSQLTPYVLPTVLDARFRAWGIDNASVRIAQALQSSSGAAPSAPRMTSPALPAPLAPSATRPGAQAPATPAPSRTVADLQAANAARAKAAQTSGPVTGAPLASGVPTFTGPGALERTLRAAKQRQTSPLAG